MSEYVIIIPSYKGSNVENCAYEMSKTSLVSVSTMNRCVLSFISCERYSFVCVCGFAVAFISVFPHTCCLHTTLHTQHVHLPTHIYADFVYCVHVFLYTESFLIGACFVLAFVYFL